VSRQISPIQRILDKSGNLIIGLPLAYIFLN
jgi:hypothetical protein